MASISTSSSTTAPSNTRDDVFLSFRGFDTRRGFTSHLNTALHRKHIRTFIDENDLKRGEEISTLLRMIEECKSSVIVISENYASSPWCLDELVKIMECRKKLGRKAIPIFYNVEPFHVRHQTGKFGEGFEKNKERFSNDEDRVRKWCSALAEVANLHGWNSTKNEAELVEKVAEDIVQKLNPTASNELIGMDLQYNNPILSWLSKKATNDVRFVGLFGMGKIS